MTRHDKSNLPPGPAGDAADRLRGLVAKLDAAAVEADEFLAAHAADCRCPFCRVYPAVWTHDDVTAARWACEVAADLLRPLVPAP